MRVGRSWMALLVLVLALLLMAYAPIATGRPVGWSLYAYWTLLALAALSLGTLVEPVEPEEQG